VKRLGTIVAREFRKALPATIFFFVLFHLISLTKVVALNEGSLNALHAVRATVAALLVAKAILVVEALPIARFHTGTRFSVIVLKTLLYSAVTLLFRLLEELISLTSTHHGVLPALRSMVSEISWPLFTVLALWILGGLFLYCLAAELVKALGRDAVKHLLFDHRVSP